VPDISGAAGILRMPAADISGDTCLDYIGTWRQEYFVSGVYNFKKFDFDQKTIGIGIIFFMAVKGLKYKLAHCFLT